MSPLLLLLAGLALGVLIGAVLRRPSRSSRAGLPPAPTPPPDAAQAAPLPPPTPAAEPPPAAPAPPRSLAELARELESFYESSAHPSELAANATFLAGVAQLADPGVAVEQVANYQTGANKELAAMAGAALTQRTDSAAVLARVLASYRFAYVWTNFYSLEYLIAHANAPVVGIVLVRAPEWWTENAVMPQLLSDFIDARIGAGETLDLIGALNTEPREDTTPLEALLAKLATPHASTLREQLAEWKGTRVDRKFLASVGKLRALSTTPPIEHAYLLTGVSVGLEAINQSPPRSFVITGEPGAGKSALFDAIAARLEQSGWTIFEASATDVGAGMSYIGELEGRLRRLLDELDVRRRVVWYAPNIPELFYAGRHRMNPSGILDMILPAVEAGRIVVIGEASPTALERVVQQRPRMRGAFASLALEPLEPGASIPLAEAFLAREAVGAGITAGPELVREALELARHYLGARVLPGSLLELLRLTIARVAKGQPKAIGREDLLATLIELTGLPMSVLDERAGLDPTELRAYFARRVMGQPEAVHCLVDRVAMLKAGLTDPHRPLGVFLFAGPTGTGKTEVAKTLATYLFGSAERMIRLDMSEFQEPASMMRILGDTDATNEATALTQRIRKQPFSVVLLDEFEKAHPRVWDLFLQVFDDGRLTDAQGATADFRHSIIILTSNLGATAHQGSSLGFNDSASPFSATQVTRAIAQTFRPEFVNRLDRVVVFRPLSRTVMREILKKELADVLQRRGFRSREWAVEWEDSAIEFLLERGFTPDMGARPLRRAIEQYVLAPLAMTIVERRHPEGDQFLFVRSDGSAIQVQFVDPDAPATPPPEPEADSAGEPPRELALGRVALAAAGTADEARFLVARVDTLEARLAGDAWGANKQSLLERMNAAGFWDEPERFGVIDQIERIDRIEAGATTSRSLADRLARRRGAASSQVAANLAEQLYLIEAAIADLDAGRASDVYLALEPVAGDAQARDTGEWTRRLSQMYQQWAKRRRMRCTVLTSIAPPFVLAIAGFGAHCILAREAGLHVFETPEEDGGYARSTVRVRIAPQPVTPKPPQQAELDYASIALTVDASVPAVVRRYRERPSPLVRDAVGGWRTGRLNQVLGGDFDLMQ